MISKMKYTAVAAAFAALPMAASAATLDPNNEIVDGGTYDIFADDSFFFGATYNNADGADVLTFTFENTSGSSQTVATTFGTVLQDAVFTGGVTIEWASGTSQFVAEGTPAALINVTSVLAAGASDTLTVTFGDVVGGPTAFADIDMFIAAVPLPAAGLLLLTALGGIAVVRRRKTAA